MTVRVDLSRALVVTLNWAVLGLNVGIVAGDLVRGRWHWAALQALAVLVPAVSLYLLPKIGGRLDAARADAVAHQRTAELSLELLEQAHRSGRVHVHMEPGADLRGNLN